ncbi:MAG: hypothetical protein P1V20_30485 [Verrucomicrobiales bacterium]|nr:hypothetical protein [Verrucomicrobiales bacterium]
MVHLPDKGTELTGDGDDNFVAVDSADGEFAKAVAEPVLGRMARG